MKNLEIKKNKVKEFTELLESYPIIGIVNVDSLPAKQLQTMRRKLMGKVLLRMTKVRLLKKAIENSTKPKIKDLENYLDGMVMVLFSKENPFSLFKVLKKNKSSAPAKAGQKAPKTILVPKGGTNLPPGPMISQLSGVGIKTGVENGKIAVKEDCVVANEGDEISSQLADVLSRLEIEPMEIGLNLNVVYENGELLTKSVLDIDEEAYLNNLSTAYNNSFSLAMEIGFITKETTTSLIEKAYKEAVTLGIEKSVLEPELMKKLLEKTHNESNSLYNKINKIEPLKEQKPTEKKESEKTETKEEKPADSAAGLGALFG